MNLSFRPMILCHQERLLRKTVGLKTSSNPGLIAMADSDLSSKFVYPLKNELEICLELDDCLRLLISRVEIPSYRKREEKNRRRVFLPL